MSYNLNTAAIARAMYDDKINLILNIIRDKYFIFE